ncbi:hypothetical protein ACERII_01375 [Evansella sp. AB-rgal1]|uniref:hypothetical protein n=1 Tax=Evansella sp. AB-rgal1 TaxID=3242696 RepID=UPI00359E06D2
MDKPKNISIRLNGKEQVYNEDSKSITSDRQKSKTPSVQEEMAASAEQSNNDWVTFERKEEESETKKIVDLGKKREEKEDRTAPYWDDGNRDKSPKLPPVKRKKRGPFKFSLSFEFFRNSVFLSILGAIFVGSAFGLMLLNIFTAGDSTVVSGAGNTNVPSSQGAVIPDDTEEGFLIPGLELFVIQGGAFSTLEKGEETVATFHRKGFPAVLTDMQDNNDLRYLFIGISNMEEDAKGIAAIYEEAEEATYVKGFNVYGYGEFVSEDFGEFMQTGVSWMESIAGIASQAVLGNEVNGELESLIQWKNQWNEAFEELERYDEEDPVYRLAKMWLEDGNSTMDDMIESTITQDIGWDLQNSVLSMALIYEQLVEFILDQNGNY